MDADHQLPQQRAKKGPKTACLRDGEGAVYRSDKIRKPTRIATPPTNPIMIRYAHGFAMFNVYP